jgi:hypothetical protein
MPSFPEANEIIICTSPRQTVDGFDVSFCHDISTIRAMYPDAQSRGGTVGELLDGFFRFYAFDFNWENHVVVRYWTCHTVLCFFFPLATVSICC